MLEIKDGVLSGVEYSKTVAGINFMVEAGEMLCIYAWHDEKRQAIIHTLLGLQPLKSGFFSIDGDVVDSRSAAYFRAHAAYVSRELQFPSMTIGEMMQMMTIDKSLTKDKIEEEWNKIGIKGNLWEQAISSVSQMVLQQMMMVVAVMKSSNYIIIDQIQGAVTPEMIAYLRQYTASGGMIIIATEDEEVKELCDKTLLEPQ